MNRLDRCDWRELSAANYPTFKSAVHVTVDDVVRMALQAYHASVREMQPPDGQRWLGADDMDPWPYSSAKDLHDGLLHHFAEALYLHAFNTGHFVEEAAPGAGRSPASAAGASMAHGCAAVAAVGPASVSHQGCGTQLEDPFFIGPEKQKLPSGPVVSHAQAAQEAATRV